MTTRPASLPPAAWRERIHVVLVEPGDSLNVGSVARAMSNLGFRNLHLVAPPRYDRVRAAQTACWATDLLEAAHTHDTLEDALAPMEQVAGFTARHGRNRPLHRLLPEWVDEVRNAPPAVTALLFGPEDHGLRAEHLVHCRWLVRIPSVEANPSFNLAQSVLLTLFELTRTDWPAIPAAEAHPPAEMRGYAELDRLVADVLAQVGFYHKGTPSHVPGLVQHLLRRTGADRRELQILLGMFGKIGRALAGKVPVQDAAAETGPAAEDDAGAQTDG